MMKAWHFAAVGLALLTILGCRTDPAVPILERELRLKEDEVYRLRGQIEDMQDCAVANRPRAAAKSDEANGRSDRGTSAGDKTPVDANLTPPTVERSGAGSTEVPPLLKGQGGSNPAGAPALPKQSPGLPAPNSKKSSGLRQPSEDSGRPAASADSLDGPALDGPPRRGATRGVRGQLAATQRDVPGAGPPATIVVSSRSRSTPCSPVD